MCIHLFLYVLMYGSPVFCHRFWAAVRIFFISNSLHVVICCNALTSRELERDELGCQLVTQISWRESYIWSQPNLGKDNKIMIYLLRDEFNTQLVTLHISETQYVMFGCDEWWVFRKIMLRWLLCLLLIV